MDTLAIALIVIFAAFLVSAIIIATVSVLLRKNRKFSEIHFSGGVNLDNGRLASDNNYFKGLSGALGDTVIVNENQKFNQDLVFNIAVQNLSNGQTGNIKVNGQYDFGRAADDGVYVINDKSVSRRHCRLTVKNRKLYINDLNSSNHTYLNGRQVCQNDEVYNGDIIKIGNTKLKIFF